MSLQEADEVRRVLDDGNEDGSGYQPTTFRERFVRARAESQRLLSSRKKHYLILGIVTLDVAALLSNVFVELIACDMEVREPWVAPVRQALTSVGLAFSCLFLAELLLTVLAFGLGYFADWFHLLDAVVIIASFVIDLISHGLVEEIGSLIIIVRLVRFVKIVEELGVGASERMEGTQQELEALIEENSELKKKLARRTGDVEAGSGSSTGLALK